MPCARRCWRRRRGSGPRSRCRRPPPPPRACGRRRWSFWRAGTRSGGPNMPRCMGGCGGKHREAQHARRARQASRLHRAGCMLAEARRVGWAPITAPPCLAVQLPLAVRYLRDTLHLQLPDIAPRAAAAAAERAAREERTRAGLRVRLAALLDTGEWQETAASARQLLREMDECFSLLAEQQAAAGRQGGGEDGAAATVPVPAAEDDGLEWEDVPAAAEVAAAEPGGEGLAAYAQPEAQDDEPEGGQGDSDLDAVLETLAGLHRQLANRTLPQVQVGRQWMASNTQTAADARLPASDRVCMHPHARRTRWACWGGPKQRARRRRSRSSAR